jgi:CubicO group peptidase (beta-lactamase class C family)
MSQLPWGVLPIAAFLTALLPAGFSAQAQSLSPEMAEKVDKVFAKWNRTDSPGCALGVYQDGKIVYKHGYGMANLNDDVTITPETVFHVASMSKQFTAAAILLLAQQGKLSIDDDVHKYIPELPDFGQKITLRQMMHHTSGLRDQWALLELAGWRYSQDLITDDDVMSVITRQKELNFKPGDKFLYSNTGFTLLAIVVKRVSGMSFREFTTKNIFEPLGMTHTHFRDDHEEVIKHDALGYEQDGPDEKGKAKPFRMNLTNFDTAGATSLHTTVEDMQLWDENFYHPRVGGTELIEQLQHRDKLNNGELHEYAFGLSIGTYKGLPTVDHSGGDAGYRSDMTRFPEQHFSATVLCNSADTNPPKLVREVADIVLAKDLKPEPSAAAKTPESAPVPPLTPAEMTAMAGTYWDREEDDFSVFQVKDGKLQIDTGTNEFHELKPFAPGHFHVIGVPWGEDIDFHFVGAENGKPKSLEQSFGGGKPQTLEPVAAFEPNAVQLAEFAGAYVSEEIDPIYRVTLQDGKLSLNRLKHKADDLKPVMKDTFSGDIGTMHFMRDGKQKVTGFVLNAGRIQNFKFTRKAN